MIYTTHRGYRYKIDRLTDEQITLIRQNIGAKRFLWNKYVEELNTQLSNNKTIKASPYTKWSKDPEYEWMKQIDSCNLNLTKIAYQNAVKEYLTKPNRGKPRYKKKKTAKQSYSTTNNRTKRKDGTTYNSITLRGSIVKLPKIGEVHIIKHRSLPNGHRITGATVEETTRGEFYVTIQFKYDITIDDVTYVSPSEIIGLDYSSQGFYVDDEGYSPQNPRAFRACESVIAEACAVKSRRVFGSVGWWRAKDDVRRAYRRSADVRRDFTMKESAVISKQRRLVFVEDLDLQSVARSLRLGKSTNDNGFGLFREELVYKLGEVGGCLVKTPRFFPSSKLCSCCGYKNKRLGLGVLSWVCPECCCVHDRDVNAAVNIRDYGLFALLCGGYITGVVDDEGVFYDLVSEFGVGSLALDFDGLYSLVGGCVSSADGASVVTYVLDVSKIFVEDTTVRVVPLVLSDAWVGAFITAKRSSVLAGTEATASNV